jgi:hypothetical protein
VTDLLKGLLGNGSVNTFRPATLGAVFSVNECYNSLLGNTTILATEEVFYMWSLQHPYNESVFTAKIRLDERIGMRSAESRTTRLEVELENLAGFRESNIQGD